MPVYGLFIPSGGRLTYDGDKDAQKEAGVAGGFVWRGPKWVAKVRKRPRTSGEIESASFTLLLSNKNRQLCRLDENPLFFALRFSFRVVRKEMSNMKHDKGTNKQTKQTLTMKRYPSFSYKSLPGFFPFYSKTDIIWWSTTKALLSTGSWTPFLCKYFGKKLFHWPLPRAMLHGCKPRIRNELKYKTLSLNKLFLNENKKYRFHIKLSRISCEWKWRMIQYINLMDDNGFFRFMCLLHIICLLRKITDAWMYALENF